MTDEADKKRGTVKVGCLVPNGVELTLTKIGEDDGTGSGYRPRIPDRSVPPVRLRGPHGLGLGAGAMAGAHVVNEGVDAEFFAEWLKQNEKNPLVAAGHVFLVEE